MVKKFTSLTCCLLLIFNLAIAQSDTLLWYPDIKLKFSDFPIDTSTNHIFGDILAHYDYTFQPTKFGKYIPVTSAYTTLNQNTATLPDLLRNTPDIVVEKSLSKLQLGLFIGATGAGKQRLLAC